MNKVKKQIIYVWDYLEWGGVQIYFIALMRCLSKKYSVKAILPANSAEKLIDYLRKDNLNFEFFDSEKAASETLGFLGRIRRRIQNLKCNFVLANRLSKEDLGNSIIHIDSSPWANFLFLFYLLLKTDVFITFHTTLPKISKISELIWTLKFSILCKFSSLHIAVSNLEVKESLRKYLSVEKFGKTELAYSGINTDEIKNILKNPVNRENIIERYDFPRTSFWICNVGQFIERKGCWFLLEALKELRLTGESVFFYWLGTADLNDETERRIDAYGLGETFRYLSANEIGQSRSDLLNLVSVSDLFVMPSLEEGLPIGLVEAMALKRPVIASEINAIPEAVTHLKTGFLIPPSNPGMISRAIRELIADAELRTNLGKNANGIAFDKFDENRSGETMLKYYESTF